MTNTSTIGALGSPAPFQIPQLRYEVNYSCGKACGYCRPGGEGPSVQPEEMLTLHEIEMIFDALVEVGMTDAKLTGGEPGLRPDIVGVVETIKGIPGVDDLHMVTRHARSGALAAELAAAGLDVLNFSIDSLSPTTWAWIVDDRVRAGDTRAEHLRIREHARLLSAVQHAAAVGPPVKINTVLMAGINTDEVPALIDFAGSLGATIKFLDLIDDIDAFDQGFGKAHYFDPAEILPSLREASISHDIDHQPGAIGHPMPRFQMGNGATVLVKTASSGAFYNLDDVCGSCPAFPCHDALMALRLTPDGKLQRCLLRSDNLVDLRRLVADASPAEVRDELRTVLSTFTGAKFFEPGATGRHAPVSPTSTTQFITIGRTRGPATRSA